MPDLRPTEELSFGSSQLMERPRQSQSLWAMWALQAKGTASYSKESWYSLFISWGVKKNI